MAGSSVKPEDFAVAELLWIDSEAVDRQAKLYKIAR